MENLISILLLFLVIGCLVKVILFFTFKSKRDKLPFLFHYPYPVIILTENKTKQKIKKIQNGLSQSILFVLIFYIVLYYITKQQ